MIAPFNHGPKILVDFGNVILAKIEPYLPLPTPGTRIQRFPGGSLLTSSGSNAVPYSWPWQVFDTSINSGMTHTAQVQVGGNGFLAALNAFVSNVSGSPTNVSPYPQVAVSGNGYIYAKATPTTAGTASPLTSLDITFQTSIQAQDTSNPAGYYWMLLATITNYAAGPPVSFTLTNQFGPQYGPSTALYCGGVIEVY